MKLRSFSGYRGVAGLFQIGDIRFMIVAPTAEQLEILYNGLLKESGPFNPAACAPSIVISSKVLPEPKTNNEQQSSPSSEA